MKSSTTTAERIPGTLGPVDRHSSANDLSSPGSFSFQTIALGAGVHSLTAQLDGNSITFPAPVGKNNYVTNNDAGSQSVALALTINPTKLVVTADDAHRLAMGHDPTLTPSETGFVNGDGPASLLGTLAIVDTTSADAGPGVYPGALVASGLTSVNSHDRRRASDDDGPLALALDRDPGLRPVSEVLGEGQPDEASAGQVRFTWDSGKSSPSIPVDQDGDATFTTADFSTIGLHAITAHFFGGTISADEFLGSSATSSLTFSPALTAKALSPSSASIGYGLAIESIASVSSLTDATTEPTGMVQFVLDGVDTGQPRKVELDGMKAGPSVSMASGSAKIPIPAAIGAGTHSLSASDSGDASFSSGNAASLSLPVAKAPLVVIALDEARGQGQPNSTLGDTISGFVNGSATIAGFQSVATSAAAVMSPPGRYPIVIGLGTLSSPNYAFAQFVNETLKINSSGAGDFDGDGDGDGKADLAVYDLTAGSFLILESGGGSLAIPFGNKKHFNRPIS